MTRTLVHTDNAPAAVGPYSQAIRVGDFLYTSGQIAIDPSVGAMIDGDVSAQTEQVLRNLRAVLEAGGSSMERVIKTTVFMTTMTTTRRSTWSTASTSRQGARLARRSPSRSFRSARSSRSRRSPTAASSPRVKQRAGNSRTRSR